MNTVTVAIVITSTQDDDIRVLLLQRNPDAYPGTGYVDPFPYCWEMIGGHVEPGEEPIEGALREVREETGINLSAEDCHLVGVSEFRCKGEQAHNWLYAVETEVRWFVFLSPEHLAYAWTTLPKAQAMQLAFKHSELLAQIVASRVEQ